MSLTVITALWEAGKYAIDKFYPNPKDKADALYKLEELKQKGDMAELSAHVTQLTGQMRINEQEAKHPSRFVAGWRPSVGWICGISLLYVSTLEPLMRFISQVVFGYEGSFPEIDATLTIPILLGMLGISHHRSEDKKNGTVTSQVK